MQLLKQSIIIPFPSYECLQVWISANCYPGLPIVNTQPEIPMHWSSSNAWGENRLYGHSQLEWSLSSLPGNPHYEITWHKELCLKDHLIQVSGHVYFEPCQENKTCVTLSIHCKDTISNEQLSVTLQRCLETFKSTSYRELTTQTRLKAVV